MALTKTLMLLMSAWLASGQRPFFAGSKPIGYPELLNKTTTPSGLGDKFGEGTNPPLPIEANGDRELIDRLSKLPIDKQPFWFINWQAYQANREKPQTYPQRPNPFIVDNLQNTAVINNPTNPPVIPSGNNSPGVNVQTVNTEPSVDNTKTDTIELNNRYAADITTLSATTTKTISTTNDNKNTESVNSASTDAVISPVSTTVSKLAVIPYVIRNKDVKTPNLDASTETIDRKTPEVKVVEGSSVENEKIESVKADVSDKEQADVVPLAIDTTASKPEVKIDDEITMTRDCKEYVLKSRKIEYEKDDYEDIEVRNTIKLLPGIIQKYQR